MADYDEDEIFENTTDDTPIPHISEDFRRMLLECKHALYMAIVFGPSENSVEGQSDVLNMEYVTTLSNLKMMLDNITTSSDNSINLKVYPEAAHQPIHTLLSWYSSFLEENSDVPTRIPYIDYIKNSLHIFPYIQTDEFENSPLM